MSDLSIVLARGVGAERKQLLRELRDKGQGAQLWEQLGERHRGEMVRARARWEEAEAALEELEGRQTGDLDTDQETELLESVKRSHEILDTYAAAVELQRYR